MPYTADERPMARSAEELRSAIPGWGVDKDPKDRPSVPRERRDLETGAHWEIPEQQPEKWPRERSIEHARLTPVFGTSCPPRGVSGAIRRFAFRYSEGRAAHWLLLVAGDRVDAFESHVRSMFTMRPDNPITQTGIRSELTHGGITSRLENRADLAHQPLDPLIVAGPWVVAAGVAFGVGRSLVRAARS